MAIGSLGMVRYRPKERLVKLCGIALLGALALVVLKLLFKENAPIRQRSVSSLSADLGAGFSAGARYREVIWNATSWRLQSKLKFLKPPDYRRMRLDAAMEIEWRAGAATNAVMALIRGIANEDVRDYEIAQHEFLALGRMGPGARPAVHELLNWVANTGKGRGTWNRGAAWALARIAPEDPHVTSTLLFALATYGPENEYADISPAEFNEPIQGWRPSGRRNLIRALALVSPQTPRTLAALYGQLDHGDYGAQATAAHVLGKLRPIRRETVAALSQAFLQTGNEHLPDSLTALAKAWALGANNPLPLRALATNGALTDENAVSYAHLVVPGTPLEEFETIYLPYEGFPGWGLRLRLIRALGEIGPDAQEALPLLEASLTSTNIFRFDAAVAAWRISRFQHDLTPIFTKALRQGSEDQPRALARLYEMAWDFPDEVNRLVLGLEAPEKQIWLDALQTLPARKNAKGLKL